MTPEQEDFALRSCHPLYNEEFLDDERCDEEDNMEQAEFEREWREGR